MASAEGSAPKRRRTDTSSNTERPMMPPNYWENGRMYHGFHKGAYMFPCDEKEKDKMDIMHKFFLVCRKNKFFSVPLKRNYDVGPRILDLGTGTGIWAIDVADKYKKRGFEVKGWDLSAIQPPRIPENASFSLRDFETPWFGVSWDSWDLIHMRCLSGSVHSWEQLYQKCWLHLKPGAGWIEHVEVDWIPQCDDGTLVPNAALRRWIDLLIQATAAAHRALFYRPDTRAMLEASHFVDIGHEVITAPQTNWAVERHPHEMGRWMQFLLERGIEGMTMQPLTRCLGWSPEMVHALCADVMREVNDRNIHVYFNVHIWIARKPLDKPPGAHNEGADASYLPAWRDAQPGSKVGGKEVRRKGKGREK